MFVSREEGERPTMANRFEWNMECKFYITVKLTSRLGLLLIKGKGVNGKITFPMIQRS